MLSLSEGLYEGLDAARGDNGSLARLGVTRWAGERLRRAFVRRRIIALRRQHVCRSRYATPRREQ